jgi:hypothetical protein
VLFAVERKDRRDARGNGMLKVQERLEARVGRAPALLVVKEKLCWRCNISRPRRKKNRALTSTSLQPLSSLTGVQPLFLIVHLGLAWKHFIETNVIIRL